MSNPVPDARSAARLRVALAAVALLGIAGLAALGVYTWQSLGDVEMDDAGYIALVLGVLGTAALGGGLMTLLFYSHRHGYDDAAGSKQEKRF